MRARPEASANNSGRAPSAEASGRSARDETSPSSARSPIHPLGYGSSGSALRLGSAAETDDDDESAPMPAGGGASTGEFAEKFAEPSPALPVRMSVGGGARRVRVVYAYEARRTNRHHSYLHAHECELACDQAAEEDELTIAVGEVVEVICAEGGWWVGRAGDTVGSFPSNYVEPL